MKTRNLFYLLLMIGLLCSTISCLDLFKDKKDEQLSPDQAKIEIRSANQRIQAENDELMNMPGSVTLNYLADLTSNESWKSSLASVLFDSDHITYHKLKDIFVKDNHARSVQYDYLQNPGTYRFNFELDRFEQIEPSSTMLKMIFPANEQAYAEQELNAELIADDLQFTPISYTSSEWDDYTGTWITETITDTITTNATISLKIDEATVLTGSYHSTLTNNGTPTSVDISLTMSPYQFLMGFSGSGVNYSTTLSMKLNNEEIMGYSLSLTYSSDMEDILKIEGSYRIPPVKFEGSINYYAIETHIDQADSTQTYDLEYLNTQIDVIVYQTELEAQLGKLVFMLYTDPDDGDQSPQLAVQYSDDTWEWLETIMDEGGSKRSGTPWEWCFY